MEWNINVKIDVTERASACVASLIGTLQRVTVADNQAAQACEATRQQEHQERQQEQQEQEQKPARVKAAAKTSGKTNKAAEPAKPDAAHEEAKAAPDPKPEAKEDKPKPEPETKPADNPDTAQNVGNDMPMDDGSRKEKEEKPEAQDGPGSRDELISEMRKSMNECMERFIGPDYKNQTNSPRYKKYNGMLRTCFMRIASELAAGGNYKLKPNETMKPSMLNEQDLRQFIMEVDLLIPDPQSGEISKKNIF